MSFCLIPTSSSFAIQARELTTSASAITTQSQRIAWSGVPRGLQ